MGRVIKHEGAEAMRMESGAVQRMKSFARGEATWAEVEGMTFEEAKAIAQVGCDLAAAGRLEEARILFEGLVAGNPRDAGARAALGTVYQKLGRLEEAIAEYSAALARDAAHPVALANRGELYLRKGERQGFTDLSNAVEVDPHGETAAGRRARALVKAITLVAVEKLKQDAQQP
ncbi:tetratricopeptide repeat protein [Myxococcus sp. CA051A]|uniref:Tetratricopeptide repeat protein n=1 Tax=Myxococcus llanfairpwllgwyngyllgogerychwyrndrobwllllantysiliogogogochensis TaxID=2590453 RepID=A0A540WWK2_9BACT|nr:MULTISPECIES: tetratricopeptide repeat protein [Myxococcus]NTX00548.1 tetratricopeptide repeat protein [Myxococcus sp. CA040A]NTX12749.1 tetratricopeptide repeat protein [Myxococcus sp. CA056]NTX33768.1 tetratricopeptide repeat protein [Myxococcus sp. CA033]NTX58355.1 tetratricopeptide repeat protein [Myxococcus sp. CA039A]NTX59125.1 tetratricopeptide repeat protein [Myxococcus sp. CA051A]